MDRFESHRRELPDALIARIASRQYGIVSLTQLRSTGLSASAVHKRLAAGRLHRVHAETYAVGHMALTYRGRWMAAVLACGPHAVLSHRSAAMLWGINKLRLEAVDVTAPDRRGRWPYGIRAHRSGSLTGADRTSVDRIPCTSVARTLLDLAAVVSPGELRKAVGEAEMLGILDLTAASELIRRSRGRRGVARLRAITDELDPRTARTSSEMERRFLALCARGRVPTPAVNATLKINGRLIRPDFLWRDARLIVETDGRRFHGTGVAFERDRLRDQELMLDGWRVMRCTWTQLCNEPERIIQTVKTLLAATQPQPTGLKPE